LLHRDGVIRELECNEPMKAKAMEYRFRAARCDERAKRERDPEKREWQLILARAYRMLAEAESETEKQPLKLAA